jgi:L-asparaginase II
MEQAPLTTPILAKIVRGNLVESIHRGHLAVVDCRERVLASLGNPHYVTYARSSAKLLQGLAIVHAGVADRYGFDERAVAVMCGSHNGEVEHVETVRAMLGKMGLPEAALKCGVHPLSAAALRQKPDLVASAVHHNCSGKHAGMLALAQHLGADPANYLERTHPVQQYILDVIASFVNMNKDDIVIGIDGCGVPVFGLPLAKLALAYAKLGATGTTGKGMGKRTQVSSEFDLASQRVIRAITANPEMIAGTERYDTALIRATRGRLIGKEGAEGVFAIAHMHAGEGFVMKVEDGSNRSLFASVTAALLQLGWIHDEETESLLPFHKHVIRNYAGTEVGQTVPTFKIVK